MLNGREERCILMAFEDDAADTCKIHTNDASAHMRNLHAVRANDRNTDQRAWHNKLCRTRASAQALTPRLRRSMQPLIPVMEMAMRAAVAETAPASAQDVSAGLLGLHVWMNWPLKVIIGVWKLRDRVLQIAEDPRAASS